MRFKKLKIKTLWSIKLKITSLLFVICLFSPMSFADDLILKCNGTTIDNKTNKIEKGFRVYTFKGENIAKGGNSDKKGIAYHCSWSDQEILCNKIIEKKETVFSRSDILIYRVSGDVQEDYKLGPTKDDSILDMSFIGKCEKTFKKF